jgi:hypothetical protein
MTVTEIISMVRDISFLSLLLVGPLLAYLVYRKVSAALKAARRTMAGAQEIVSTLSDSFVSPASTGPAGTLGAVRAAGRLLRRSRRRARGGDGADGNE